MSNLDPELQTYLREARLHLASQRGEIENVLQFLKEGDDVNFFDEIGYAPLHYAVEYEKYEVIEILLKNGANINAHDEKTIGNTPLGNVTGECSLKMAKYLLEKGANPNIRGWMRLNALDRAEKNASTEGDEMLRLLKKYSSKYPKEDI